ncbi:MAG: hypothetical protein IJO32_01010 [Bacilli bacterium]|nr:hypothetical protein [Bacilli bacterium]
MFSKKNRCYDMNNNMMWQNDMDNTKNKYLVNMPMDSNYDMNKDGMAGKCDMKMPKQEMMGYDQMMGCKMQPVYECPIEKCVHRTICHEIPHVCPVNTKIINHHVYRHTYAPCYTCSEENEVCHVQEGSCCCFR